MHLNGFSVQSSGRPIHGQVQRWRLRPEQMGRCKKEEGFVQGAMAEGMLRPGQVCTACKKVLSWGHRVAKTRKQQRGEVLAALKE